MHGGVIRPERATAYANGTWPKGVFVAGSTGSIGQSTLDVIRAHRDLFRVVGLSARSNVDLLEAQVKEFLPRYVVLSDPPRGFSRALFPPEVELHGNGDALADVVQDSAIDVVVAGVVGISGLASVLSALKAGKRVALANKESLVAAGMLVREVIESVPGAEIIPVDSEHSALFQALSGEKWSNCSSLILTASGGPFLNTPKERFHSITPQEAVKHPRWNMGAKISVDSATLVNKALELIEAHFLFGMPESRIEVVVHPQSIIHSLVRLIDGSLIAQMSLPDMKAPIAYALSWPRERLKNVVAPLSLSSLKTLDFHELDAEKFPAITIARDVVRKGGLAPALFNLANEIAVSEFLAGRLTFDKIVPSILLALDRWGGDTYTTFDDLVLFHNRIAREFLPLTIKSL